MGRRRSKLRPLGIRQQERLLSLLREAYEHATLEHADFGSFWVQGDKLLPFPTTDKQVTPFIIERTQTYRQSWLLSPLSRAIELIQSNGTQPQPPAVKE
jgi:hypothetical protein